MNEQDVLKIMADCGAVLTDGHFVYNSGKHGTAYVAKDMIYPSSVATLRLCFAMAEHFKDDGVEVVVGPEKGGIILEALISYHLSLLTGCKVVGVYAEKVRRSLYKAENEVTIGIFAPDESDKPLAKVSLSPGEELFVQGRGFEFGRGYGELVAGKNVLIAEDVLTTGGSAKRTVEAVRMDGGHVAGVAVLCNRGGVTAQDVGNVPELFALANVALESWTKEECLQDGPCSKGVPVNTQFGKGGDFLARQAMETAGV